MGILRTVVEPLLTRIPQRTLGRVEMVVQAAQGKGAGAGDHEREVAAIVGLLPEHLRTSAQVLDVGANVGRWTEALLDQLPDAAVWCFEPSSHAAGILSERISDRAAQVRVVRVALAAEEGSAELWSDRPGSGLASLSRRRTAHHGIEFVTSERVPVTTLDRWAGDSGVRPDIIKLDVEGHELAVLRGGTSTLARTTVVQFEFGGANIDSRTYLQDIWYFLTGLGFVIHRVAPRALVPLRTYREIDECFRTTNFIAVRCT